MKVLIVYYSMYGHIYQLAQAVEKGVRQVNGIAVDLRRVPETLSDAVMEKMGAVEAQKLQAHVPICTVDELGEADAIIFGTPTRFGNMCGQMRQLPRWNGKTVDERCAGRKGGQRLCQFEYAARRTGIDDS
jgi:NAD(P)H dehydrogenase (quinone)